MRSVTPASPRAPGSLERRRPGHARHGTRHCPQCARLWQERTATFCGHCGELLLESGGARPRPRPTRLALALVLALAVVVTALFVGGGSTPGVTPRGADPGATPGDAPVHLPRTAVSPEPLADGAAAAPSTTPEPATAPNQALPLRWQFTAPAPITAASTLTRADGGLQVVVTTEDGRVVGLDGQQGRVRWEQVPRPGPARLVATDASSNLVLLTAPGAQLIALDAHAGVERWRHPLSDVSAAIRVVPRAVGGADPEPGIPPGDHFARSASDAVPLASVVLIGGRSGRLVALDADDGQVHWERVHTGGWVATPGALVTADRGGLEGWSLEDGTTRWRREQPDTPVDAVGDRVLVRDRDEIAWLDAATGDEQGRLRAHGTWWGEGPGGTLVVTEVLSRPSGRAIPDESVQVRLIEPDGSLRWRVAFRTGPRRDAPRGCCLEVATTPEGRIVTLDRRRFVHDRVLDATDGRVLAELMGVRAGRDASVVAVVEHAALIRTAGELAARSVPAGEERWRLPGSAFVIATDPLVIGTRRLVLALEPDSAPGPDPIAAGARRR